MTSSDIVFVTGATGFIGAHCVGLLLLRDYRVRAHCRSEVKFDLLAACVPGEKRCLLEPAFGSDITDLADLTELMAGCTGVIHLASPFTFNVQSFEKDLLQPALRGTEAVLEAALAVCTVRRVVITSSFAAVYDANKGEQAGEVLDESNFSPLTWEDGALTKDPAVAYRASKTVAENAAWDFMKRQYTHFDLVVLCPTMVYGPLYSTKLISSLDELNFSNQMILRLLGDCTEVPPTQNPVWVDVRDLAEYHVNALFAPGAKNQRFLISAGDYDNQEIVDVLRASLPEYRAEKIAAGTPGKRLTGTHYTTNSSKGIKILGVPYRSLESCVLDLANQLISFEK